MRSVVDWWLTGAYLVENNGLIEGEHAPGERAVGTEEDDLKEGGRMWKHPNVPLKNGRTKTQGW